MSLLNEMVNDLNKAKSCNGEGILLHTEYSWFRRNMPSMLKAFFVGIALSVCLFAVLKIIKPHKAVEEGIQVGTQTKAPVVVEQPKKKSVSQKEFVSSFPNLNHLVFESVKEAPKFIDVETDSTKKTGDIAKKAYPLTEQEWFEYSYNEALLAIDDEDYEGAINKLEQILEKKASASNARETLALIYIELEEETKALNEINKGLEIDKNAVGLIKLKAQFLHQEGKLTQAIQLMEGLEPNINEHPDYYAVLAAAYEGVGKILKAGSLYKDLLRVDPDNGQFWLGYALSLEEMGNTQQAIDAYQHAANSENGSSAVHVYASDKLVKLKG